MLKKYCKLNKADYQVLFFFPLILWLLVFLGTPTIMLLVKQKDVLVLVYPAFALFVPPMMMGVYGLVLSKSCFDVNLSFGCTRKRALALVLGHLLLCTVLTVLMYLGLHLLDSFLTPRVVAALLGFNSFHAITEAGSGLSVEFFPVHWWWFILPPFAAALIGLSAGALIRRYGARMGWALYALFMILILSFNNDAPWMMGNVPVLAAALVLLAVVGFVWAVRDLLRTSVKC